jgi:hypothetical protein
MNPEDVERLLQRFEHAGPPERLERKVLAEGEMIARRGSAPAFRPARGARDLRRWGIAGVAAACLTLSVLLWRVLVPRPGDPGWVPCRSAIEFETPFDASAAAGPPAFPSGAPSLEAYAPLFRRADAVKPLVEELRWQGIPWVTDLEEAERLARTERRPLFLWVASDDPLGRCCNCAAGLRAGPLSQEEVALRISAGFVPAAVDRKALTRKGEEFLRSLQRQRPQYHGVWIVSPEGKVLAGHEKRKAPGIQGWTQEILETLDAGLHAFGPVEPRAVSRVNLFPWRGAGVRPGGSVSLAVHARLMHQGARDGPVVFDSLALAGEEWAVLVPPRRTAGEEWAVPDALARRFCRIVSPVSDPEFVPRPEHARVAELRAAVVSVDGDTATIRLSGRWETEHSTSEGKPIKASASGEGVAVFDVRTNAMRSLLLVTSGVFGSEAASKARETGAVAEWRRLDP